MLIENSDIYEWTSSGPISFKEFLAGIRQCQTAGKRVVTTNGCFDWLHVGHLRFLEQARSLGDVLVVGLNSDASVRKIKGVDRPLLPENDRAALLAGLKPVDHVLIFNDNLPSSMLAAIRPDVHCKAGDYSSESLPEASVVQGAGGEIRILPAVPGYSTSKLVEKILLSSRESEKTEVRNLSSAEQLDQVMDYFLSSSNLLRQTGYQLAEKIVNTSTILLNAIHTGHKILVCGNGGSAADAQHFATELVVRYKSERQALNAQALTTDSSILTAIGNDLGFEQIFSRQVQACGLPGDVLVAISTSGSSPNILAAVRQAKEIGLETIGLTGGKASQLQKLVGLCLEVPSLDTPQIQQAHTVILHTLCNLLEARLLAG